jgi:hypothetical protein
MKAPLAFDPGDHDYGPGTVSVRSLLTTWADIDWFEPTATSDSDAIARFDEHNERAHAAAPELFPERVQYNVVYGQWPEFEAWSKRVRESTSWDWKYGALKKLSRNHSQALGWSLAAWAKCMPESVRPGDLVHRFRDANGKEMVFWGHVHPHGAIGDPSDGFYLSYAHGDLLDAIQWQLAERHDDLSSNPFDSLLRCYHAGIYPFSLGPSTVVLFRWAAAGQG